ncbi:MAG: flagellar hook-basal body complex protein [Devosia sp.]
MGIYGALSTAVTGLRAQSFALENISGNIANSQTTGFKRIETDFVDLIPDAPSRIQSSGSVLARSRATNTQQGDVKSVSNATYMAVNGSGFFVVEPAIGQADGNAVFGGANYYTRRGDFDVDKSGYLVNGSGYYLKGLPIDAGTGNIKSSLPEVIRISNSFLPARPTSRVNYQLNLPQLPKTIKYQQNKVAGSEIFTPQSFKTVANDTPSIAAGATAATGAASTGFATVGDTFTVKVGANAPVTFTFTSGGGTSGTNIDLLASTTIDNVMTAINGNAGVAGASLTFAGGKLQMSGGTANAVTLTDNTSGMGFTDGTVSPSLSMPGQLAQHADVIKASDSDEFNSQTISGGSVTVYTSNGAPADVQLRWAKVESTDIGAADRWNLYYQNNGAATGAGTMWTRVPTDYTFGADGALNPPLTETNLTGVTIDGVAVGSLKLQFGNGGITQFNDPNGIAGVTAMSQNGYAAGQFVSVAINDNGRVVVSYDNNQQVETAQVVTADFNASNQLKRLDGGIFAATADSGEPILDTSGGIVGSSIESSNTDISEEFTKLIVTQQAYAAGTRIVSTANQMIQEALNMVR